MHCEWAKSHAQADRWAEEVLLLTKEMRRVIAFLDWKANWWVRQSGSTSHNSQDIVDGMVAYAAKQTHIMGALAVSFAVAWYPTLVKNGIIVELIPKYVPPQVVLSDTVVDDVDQDYVADDLNLDDLM